MANLTLHLGVEEFPYNEPAPAPKKVAKARKGKKRARRRGGGSSGGQTTYDVAVILEAHYHVFRTFYEVHEEEIAEQFAQGMADAIDTLVAGGPPSSAPWASAEQWLIMRFRKFLESKEMDSLSVPGVPTGASLKGTSHRRKGKKGSPGRPSFIDTGLYESAMVAWIEGQFR